MGQPNPWTTLIQRKLTIHTRLNAGGSERRLDRYNCYSLWFNNGVQGTHILGASRGRLCDSSAVLYVLSFSIKTWFGRWYVATTDDDDDDDDEAVRSLQLQAALLPGPAADCGLPYTSSWLSGPPPPTAVHPSQSALWTFVNVISKWLQLAAVAGWVSMVPLWAVPTVPIAIVNPHQLRTTRGCMDWGKNFLWTEIRLFFTTSVLMYSGSNWSEYAHLILGLWFTANYKTHRAHLSEML